MLILLGYLTNVFLTHTDKREIGQKLMHKHQIFRKKGEMMLIIKVKNVCFSMVLSIKYSALCDKGHLKTAFLSIYLYPLRNSSLGIIYVEPFKSYI